MRIVFVIVSICLCCSCGDRDLLDFDKMDKPQGWEPTFSFVLARGDFSMWDLLKESASDSATLKKDENGQLLIEYKRPEIYTIGVDDLYSMKAEDMFFNGSFPINRSYIDAGKGTVQNPYYDTLRVPFQLEQLLPEVSIREATLSIKSMTFIVMNNANIGGTLTVVCENLYSLETGDKIAIPLTLTPGKPTTFYSTEVPNLKAVLNGSDIVPLTFVLKVTDIAQMQNNQNVLIDIATAGVDYKNVNLFLPSAEIPLPQKSFIPEIALLNDLSGDFEFVRPELQITARTKGLGADFYLRPMVFTAVNAGKMLQTDEVFGFAGENQNVNEVCNNFSYDISNSNIQEFTDVWSGNKIEYGGGELRYGGGEMWLYAGGKLIFDLTLKIPLELSATELVYYDTIRDLNLKNADKILEARLRMVGENGIQMEFGIPEVLLLDENNGLLDRIVNENPDLVFPAANEAGPANGSILIAFNEKNLRYLAKSKRIVLKIVAKSTPGKTAVIDAISRLTLRLNLEARVDMGGVVFD